MAFDNRLSKAWTYIPTFVVLCLFLFSAHFFLAIPGINVLPSLSSSSLHNTFVSSSLENTAQPPWLLITSSASCDFQRRLIVRWTWVNLFRGSGLFDHIFAIASTDPVLIPLLKKENETFGDILLLDGLKDDEWTANHIKPFEFFKKVTDEGWKGRTYDYVSKVDQDSFVDPVRTWDRYLKARMDSLESANDRLMLSMPHEQFCGYPAPQGGFYTLSWELAKLIGRLYEMKNSSDIWQEDCMIGGFPTNAQEPYEFIAMDGEESFDVVGEKGNAVARDWSEGQVERGGFGQLTDVKFLHQMKEEWKWMFVKDLFDEDGWVPNRDSAASNSTRSRARR